MEGISLFHCQRRSGRHRWRLRILFTLCSAYNRVDFLGEEDVIWGAGTDIPAKKQKKCTTYWCTFFDGLFPETITAINCTVIARLKGNFALTSAGRADGIEHLAVICIVSTGIALASVTTGLAALGLIVKAFFRKEFLIFGSKGELLAAILARDCFVFKHEIPLY